MFHSVGRIMGWAKNYRKRMILGFVCSFFATWCTAGPVMLAAWALGRMIGNAWGENELSGSLPWLCLSGIVVLILLRFFFTYWKNRLQESIGTERAAEQRMELGDVLKRVSLGYFAKNNLGDILAALTTELSTLELQSMKMVDAVVNGYIQVAVILLCVAIFCPPAALVALIGVLVSAFALRGIRLISTGNGMSMAVISPLMIHWSYRDAQLRTLLSNPESSASGRVFGYNPKWTLAIHIGTIVGTPPAIIGIAEVGTARTALFQNFIDFFVFHALRLPSCNDRYSAYPSGSSSRRRSARKRYSGYSQ